MENKKILIKNGWVLPLNSKDIFFEKGYISILGDQICEIGCGDPSITLEINANEVIDATNMVVMPGMVNAHTHLFQTFTRGFADDKPLMKWLSDYIWPIGSLMTAYEARLSGLLGIVENIRSGVTSIIDNQYIHSHPGIDDAYCNAALEMGVRYILARGWTDTGSLPPGFTESQKEIIDQVGDLVTRWNDHPSGRIRVNFGPQAINPCSKETFILTNQYAKRWGIGTHLHIAESKYQLEKNIKANGFREVEWLDHLNCLDEKTRLVHSIWLSDEEIELIVRKNAKVVHCPISNMYLADGVARIPEMMEKGIVIALGTDGPGSNNNQDMFEVLKATALLHKITTMNASVLQPIDVIWMACRGGAEAFGQPDLIGSLEVGKKADIILVDMDTSFAVPVYYPPSALVYNLNASAVDTVMVGGNFLMRDKTILGIDEKKLLEECRNAAMNLISRAGVIL